MQVRESLDLAHHPVVGGRPRYGVAGAVERLVDEALDPVGVADVRHRLRATLAGRFDDEAAGADDALEDSLVVGDVLDPIDRNFAPDAVQHALSVDHP